jgi:hypothetical protein
MDHSGFRFAQNGYNAISFRANNKPHLIECGLLFLSIIQAQQVPNHAFALARVLLLVLAEFPCSTVLEVQQSRHPLRGHG